MPVCTPADKPVWFKISVFETTSGTSDIAHYLPEFGLDPGLIQGLVSFMPTRQFRLSFFCPQALGRSIAVLSEIIVYYTCV
jgi:hypothetical protein